MFTDSSEQALHLAQDVFAGLLCASLAATMRHLCAEPVHRFTEFFGQVLHAVEQPLLTDQLNGFKQCD